MISACTGETIRIKFDPQVEDYTPVVLEKIADNPEGNFRLVFDDATYPFYPENAQDRYMAISNNDNGQKKVVFNLDGMKNVSISGRNTKFLFHGGLIPFYVRNCENVNLDGFSVDYDYPFTLEGEVVESSDKDRSFVLKISDECLYEVRDGLLYLKAYDWELPLGENIIFNAQTESPYHSADRYEGWNGNGLKAEECGDRLVKLTGFTARLMPPVGTIYVDKGPHGQNRRYPGFVIHGSKNVNLTDVIVNRSGAMALIAERSENLYCRRFSTQVPEGSELMIAASADATHFVGCKGDIVLEDCLFESMLDDATNIHSTFMKVDTLLDSHSFMASFGHFQQEGYDFAHEGDTLLFVDRNGLLPLCKGKVTGITHISENCYQLTTDADISPYKGIELAIDNIDYKAEVLIRNSIVRKNRARSLLLSTPGNVLVEGCDFASSMAGIRICGDANYWFESGNTDNIVIRNNVFRNLGNGAWVPQAVLQIDPVINAQRRSCDRFFHNRIVFENNTVYSSESQLVYALSVRDLSIKGNRFIENFEHKEKFPGLALIDVQYCDNVSVESNDFTQWQKDAEISIHECLHGDISDTALKVTDHPNTYYYED